MHESALEYHAVLAQCVCDVDDGCYGDCLLNLCKKEMPDGGCATCIAKLADPCTKTAVEQCLQNEDCAAYGQCVTSSGCTDKP